MNLGERLSVFWKNFTGNSETMVALIVCVLVFTTLYYYLIKFLFDNDSGALAVLFVLVMLIGAGIITFISDINTGIYLLIPAVFIMATVILYSVEIKRILWARRSLKLVDVKHDGVSYDEDKIQNCITEIIKALQNMSKNDVGALIVLSDGNLPEGIIESGTVLKADISAQMIEAVFYPKAPLHDGAMVIEDNKIYAAGCFLPLNQSEALPKEMGSRHRAALGVTMVASVTAIVVSEETGIISIMKNGEVIKRYAAAADIKNALSDFYWSDLTAEGKR